MKDINFNIKRLLKMLANDLVINKKMLTIAAITVIVFLILLPVSVTAGYGIYFFVLYVGGFILSASAFNEMHHKTRAYQYLNLPCSNVERFLSKWLLTTIIYAVGLLVLFSIFGLLSILLNDLLYGRATTMFSVTSSALWLGIGKYIILQSVVLFGATLFKRHVLIKTALSVGCLALAVTIVGGIITWAICPHCESYSISPHILAITRGIYMLFWVLLAPFCWYGSYYKIKNVELN